MNPCGRLSPNMLTIREPNGYTLDFYSKHGGGYGRVEEGARR